MFSQSAHRIQLKIGGMTCAACSARIEKVVGKLEGVREVSVNLALGQAVLVTESDGGLEGRVIERIERLGYKATLLDDAQPSSKGTRSLELQLTVSLLLTLPLMWAMVRHFTFTSGIWIPELFLQPWFQWVLATPIQFVIGRTFYFRAFHAIRNKTANMDVLVAISTTSAYFYSHYMTIHMLRMGENNPHAVYFETSAMIITAVLLGKWLEASAKRRALKAIHQLRRLSPETATLVKGDSRVTIPTQHVVPGDLLIVQSGQPVPVDGIVVEGHSFVDESFVTGESIPAEKRVHQRLIGGSNNLESRILMRATAVGNDSALGKMISLMENAQASKVEIGQAVDRIAAVFVPIILILALVTLCLWSFVFTPGNWEGALFKAMAVLVIACPCALGLATPTSILTGTGRALEAGILFKDGRLVELLRDVQVVLLDKTGTVTTGVPRVTDVVAVDVGRPNKLLRYMAAVETPSEHPFAKAIVAEAERRKLHIPGAESFQAIAGYGVTALVDQSRILVGSKRFLRENGIQMDAWLRTCEMLEAQGKTVLHAACDGHYAGLVAVADTIRPTTPRAIRRLRKLRLDVILVTGDQRITASTIAAKAGITEVHANMRPEEKVLLIRKLQRSGKRVCMVGDGINDAPALAAADIGMAVGTGAEIAKEAADVNLLHSDLGGVADAIAISRRTMRNIKQNLTFALLYNVLAIPLAFMGWLAPWIAGTAMALSSVSVVTNALRLQRAEWNK
ncbi:heavy metal translocating P-type ATPase [Paenibacillus sp. HJGM_3]|uniref:heavy metal translocating P-type ATPase n=1 Tax=Paenibacillus sp. HJGM_3 TaxID=3379816 RepID=UPI0038687A42